MRVLVTGGAGFIGSHLVDALVARGDEVSVLDNLSSGRKEFLEPHLKAKKISLVHANLSDKPALSSAMRGWDVVYHLAASPEVRHGTENPFDMFESNVAGTFEVLERARENGVKKIVFASSSTVYGEAKQIPTPEDYAPLEPISFYGASKLAGEAMLSAYAGSYGFECVVFRFANIVGPRGTHGVIRDFITKLGADPKRMEILGDGRQTKSYLHVSDCISALLNPPQLGAGKFDAFNIGSTDATSVTQIADTVAAAMGLREVSYHYTGGPRGWPGDVPRFQLDIKKILATGWKPKMSSGQAVEAAAKALVKEI